MDDEPHPSRPPEGAPDPVVGRVRALLDLAARPSLAELQVEAGDFKLSVRTHGPVVTAAPPRPFLVASEGPTAEPAEVIIIAPMIGTFFLAPAPGEAPFVEIGDRVEVGQTVAIIEAMKIMNEIQSEHAGEVVEVLARNGQGVEFGQPLFRLRPR
jgi:acetyl-CoA carboxylase biotin carboxyl carrier protein